MIEQTASGAIVCTGDGVRVFQLLAAKSAIKLESLGMRHLRGSVRKAWAAHYGMPARAKHDQVIARIQQDLDRLKEASP